VSSRRNKCVALCYWVSVEKAVATNDVAKTLSLSSWQNGHDGIWTL